MATKPFSSGDHRYPCLTYTDEVVAENPGTPLGSDLPIVNGVAAAGTNGSASHQDHVHPTDTSRAPTANPIFTGLLAAAQAVVGGLALLGSELLSIIIPTSGTGIEFRPSSAGDRIFCAFRSSTGALTGKIERNNDEGTTRVDLDGAGKSISATAGAVIITNVSNVLQAFQARVLVNAFTAAFGFASWGDSSGTPGNATINYGAGKSAIAAGATTCTITSNKLGSSPLGVLAVLQTDDATAVLKNVVVGVGTFTVNLTAAATGNVVFAWMILTT